MTTFLPPLPTREEVDALEMEALASAAAALCAQGLRVRSLPPLVPIDPAAAAATSLMALIQDATGRPRPKSPRGASRR